MRFSGKRTSKKIQIVYQLSMEKKLEEVRFGAYFN